MNPNIGITTDNMSAVARILAAILADEFVLYAKSRNAHWNVEGANFHSAHLFFETQYQQLDEIVDSVAERMRTLGHYATGTLKTIMELTHLSEASRETNDADGFIRELLSDHESLIIHLREHIDPVANSYSDAGTSDFLTGLLETHEKMAWMLRAHLR